MGAVIEFRVDERHMSQDLQTGRKEDDSEWGVVIIFPGIRRERNQEREEEAIELTGSDSLGLELELECGEVREGGDS